MPGARRDLDAGHHEDLRPALRGKVAEEERAADVVMVGEGNDVEAHGHRGVEDLLRRVQPVAEV